MRVSCRRRPSAVTNAAVPTQARRPLAPTAISHHLFRPPPVTLVPLPECSGGLAYGFEEMQTRVIYGLMPDMGMAGKLQAASCGNRVTGTDQAKGPNHQNSMTDETSSSLMPGPVNCIHPPCSTASAGPSRTSRRLHSQGGAEAVCGHHREGDALEGLAHGGHRGPLSQPPVRQDPGQGGAEGHDQPGDQGQGAAVAQVEAVHLQEVGGQPGQVDEVPARNARLGRAGLPPAIRT